MLSEGTRKLELNVPLHLSVITCHYLSFIVAFIGNIQQPTPSNDVCVKVMKGKRLWNKLSQSLHNFGKSHTKLNPLNLSPPRDGSHIDVDKTSHTDLNCRLHDETLEKLGCINQSEAHPNLSRVTLDIRPEKHMNLNSKNKINPANSCINNASNTTSVAIHSTSGTKIWPLNPIKVKNKYGKY